MSSSSSSSSWRRTENTAAHCPHRQQHHHCRRHCCRSLYGPIAGYYCTSRNSCASRSDVIEKSQSYDDVSWRRSRQREAEGQRQSQSIEEGDDDDNNDDYQGEERWTRSKTGKEEKGQTKDQNQLNTIAEYLSYNNDKSYIHSCHWRYQQQPEQDKLSNIQCQEKPLVVLGPKSTRRRRRATELDSLVVLFTALLLSCTKSIGQLTTRAVQWICNSQSSSSTRLWNLHPATSSCYPAGTSIEFTLTKRQNQGCGKSSGCGEMRFRKCHLGITPNCLCFYFWSTVIVILLQNVFITANLLPLFLPLALAFCANYRHCSQARTVDTCRRAARAANEQHEEVISEKGQYHQQEVVPVIRSEKRQSQHQQEPLENGRNESSRVLWTLRQFDISDSERGEDEEGGEEAEERIRKAQLVQWRGFLVIFVLNESLFPHPWHQQQQRRRRRKFRGAEQVDVIVAKSKRKLLDFPVNFYTKPRKSRSKRRVQRISSLLVDKLPSTAAATGSCNRTVRKRSRNLIIELQCGCENLQRHPMATVTPSGRSTTADRITGQSANSSSRLVAHWPFRQHAIADLSSCDMHWTRGGGSVCVHHTQSIASFHRPDSPVIEFSHRQELKSSCTECGYNNYLDNYWEIISPAPQQRQLRVAVQENTGNQLAKRRTEDLQEQVREVEEEHLSKAVVTTIYVHLGVDLMAVALIISALKPSAVVVVVLAVKGTRRKAGPFDGDMPKAATIRVIIIHSQKGWDRQPQQEREEEKQETELPNQIQNHSLIVVVSATCNNALKLDCCSRSLRQRWSSSAISPFPFQTGTWSLDNSKCPTSLTLSWVVVVLVASHNDNKTATGAPDSPLYPRDERQKEVEAERKVEEVTRLSNSQMEWPRNWNRGAENEEDGPAAVWPSAKTNVTMSQDGRKIKLKHYNSSEDINERRMCGATSASHPRPPAVLFCPVAAGANKRRHLVLLLTVAIIFVVNLPSVSCLTTSQSAPSSPGVSGIGTFKYSTNVVKTKYGPLRGIVLRSHPVVEAYLGVPYATPPVGSLR